MGAIKVYFFSIMTHVSQQYDFYLPMGLNMSCRYFEMFSSALQCVIDARFAAVSMVTILMAFSLLFHYIYNFAQISIIAVESSSLLLHNTET